MADEQDLPDTQVTAGTLATQVEVTSAFLTTEAGRFPLLRFTFTSEHAGQRVDLVLDASTMRTFRQMVATATEKAITSARRGR